METLHAKLKDYNLSQAIALLRALGRYDDDIITMVRPFRGKIGFCARHITTIFPLDTPALEVAPIQFRAGPHQRLDMRGNFLTLLVDRCLHAKYVKGKELEPEFNYAKGFANA